MFVEMSEEEYERYKQFSDGDDGNCYAKASGKLEDLYDYLLKSGFEKVEKSIKGFIDPITGDMTASLEFKKGNTTIVVTREKVTRGEVGL